MTCDIRRPIIGAVKPSVIHANYCENHRNLRASRAKFRRSNITKSFTEGSLFVMTQKGDTELAEHLRTVHFTLIVACVSLLLSGFLESSETLRQSLEDIK